MHGPSPTPPGASVSSQARLLLVIFTAAVFTSALLLFAVQPMFARMVLPKLGGSPSVWSVAMVFFQSMLLAGYAYAHALMRSAPTRITVGVHLAVMAIAGLTLPLSIATGWGEPPGGAAAFWLLGLFTASIGLPFFALAANAPLLQAWFARTDHPSAREPYFLYAASNTGSFLALLSYPVLMEPALTLREQALVWTGGFWILFALVAGCGSLLLRRPAAASATEGAEATSPARPAMGRLGRWIFLGAVPSGLLVAVTAHISTDIAAAPFLWVIPLSLYLLTFVLVFAQRRLFPQRWVIRALPYTIALLIVVPVVAGEYVSFSMGLVGHLLAFFVIALACHGELADSKPPAEHLTTFYVSLSAGGMVGGLFAGLLAPYAFSWVAEYPILIVLAALCLPFASGDWRARDTLFWAGAVVLAAALLLPGVLAGWLPQGAYATAVTAGVAGLAVAAILLARDPPKFAFALAVAVFAFRLYPLDQEKPETVRSFFGVHKIVVAEEGKYRVLMHGTTLHGAQQLLDDDGKPVTGKPEPLTYYHADSPIAEAIAAIRTRKGGPIRVAAVGLGAGTLACYVEPNETWKFFEIDPAVIAIARDPKRFTYLSTCAPDVPIVLGDARLTMGREPDGFYDLIIVDAYSSDAIPVHLATREAMALYKSKLADAGAVVMHISNRHFELASVVAGIAAANGMRSWVQDDEDDDDEDDYMFRSEVAIAAMKPEDIGTLATDESWKPNEPRKDQRVWTDDYANIIGALLRKGAQ